MTPKQAFRAGLEAAANHVEDWTCPNCDHDTSRDLASEILALPFPEECEPAEPQRAAACETCGHKLNDPYALLRRHWSEAMSDHDAFMRSETAAELASLRARLAAAEAREAKLREALRVVAAGKSQVDLGHPLGEWFSMTGRFILTAQQALATPADNSALREFGLRVAVAVHESDRNFMDSRTLADVVDAVLRGEGT